MMIEKVSGVIVLCLLLATSLFAEQALVLKTFIRDEPYQGTLSKMLDTGTAQAKSSTNCSGTTSTLGSTSRTNLDCQTTTTLPEPERSSHFHAASALHTCTSRKRAALAFLYSKRRVNRGHCEVSNNHRRVPIRVSDS